MNSILYRREPLSNRIGRSSTRDCYAWFVELPTLDGLGRACACMRVSVSHPVDTNESIQCKQENAISSAICIDVPKHYLYQQIKLSCMIRVFA